MKGMGRSVPRMWSPYSSSRSLVISNVQPALDLVRVGPAAGAGILADLHRPGRRGAADREVAPGQQGVLGDPMIGSVAGDVLLRPRGQRVDLDHAPVLVVGHDGRVTPGGRVDPLEARHPGRFSGQGLLERAHLAELAAL